MKLIKTLSILLVILLGLMFLAVNLLFLIGIRRLST